MPAGDVYWGTLVPDSGWGEVALNGDIHWGGLVGDMYWATDVSADSHGDGLRPVSDSGRN
ncbi:hypothetical protein [Kitasatospora griseola]|uniref:hypothetical protein n=1 Tax=Kitasatospora griseola TaxID=2064 RepID=UPI0034463056